ncbi:MAG: glycosyltransferase family 2 protein [Proteobacteria bacterium]|nr:glycosyltransferase family 2 protein [Pseudomonadota bacterium]MBU1570068.1 glycosyltransferase family 2 protein [Pseudomonadota bacterium]
MQNFKVSVILPTYNEAATIGDLVLKIKDLYPDFEVIVINDGSSDNTDEVAENAGAHVYSHPYNIGNGAAIKSGIRVASGDVLVFMDADGQHDPADIAGLLKYMPDYDMVVGARSIRDQASVGRAIGNKLYNWLASYVAKFYIQDLTSGFRAIKSKIAKSFLYLIPNTYSYPTTLTLSVLRSGWSLKYIPIKIRARSAGKSSIKLIRDGVRFFMIITKICTLYSPLRIFLPVSFAIFMTGFLYYMYTLITQGRFTNMSALLITTSIIVFMMGLISEQICQMRYERREADRALISKE